MNSGPEELATALNLLDLERMAANHLPRGVFDYFAGGAADEITVKANRAAFEELVLHYRVLTGVAALDPSTTVLGQKLNWPLLVAPMAMQRLAHPEGELAVASACGTAGVPMVISTWATVLLEELVPVVRQAWFQLYVYRDRGVTQDLIRRAEAAGCTALVVTVDTPVAGRRERDFRNHFRVPDDLSLVNLERSGAVRPQTATGRENLSHFVGQLMDASLTWHDLEWLRAQTKLPILLKGIVRADDAAQACQCGMQGIVVSNHGGRQLDTAPGTLRVLPKIAAAVDGRAAVLVDGGVRRGTDLVKAIALGAQAVLVGRPILWGLALNGSAGVSRVLELLRTEFELAMALCGCAQVSQITRSLLEP